MGLPRPTDLSRRVECPENILRSIQRCTIQRRQAVGETRPTAVNLAWALEQMLIASDSLPRHMKTNRKLAPGS